MKAACEVCGAPLRSAPSKVEIDGAIMVVCPNCAKLGRPVGGLVQGPQVTRIQAALKSMASPAEPEYEVDPDYNVKIKQTREKMGLSQEDLGKLLNEKPSLIRMVETKKLKPDLMLTRKFMHHLKINLLVPLTELEGRSTGP